MSNRRKYLPEWVKQVEDAEQQRRQRYLYLKYRKHALKPKLIWSGGIQFHRDDFVYDWC